MHFVNVKSTAAATIIEQLGYLAVFQHCGPRQGITGDLSPDLMFSIKSKKKLKINKLQHMINTDLKA